MKRVVCRINQRLDIENRIEIIDAWQYEEFNIQNIPLLNKLDKDGLSEGFPFLIIDGVIIEPSPTEEMLKILLENFLNEEILY